MLLVVGQDMEKAGRYVLAQSISHNLARQVERINSFLGGAASSALTMCAYAATKRVHRNELESPASSPGSSPDPTLTALLRSRACQEYVFKPVQSDTSEGEAAAGGEDDETELRLFAAPASFAPQSHKIRLSSPDAATGEPVFIVKRPRSYYFTEHVDSERLSKLQAAAIDSETVIKMSGEPWPACALPWKVQTISPSGLKKGVLVGQPRSLFTVEEKVPKRRRKGKKGRIALRKMLQAARTKQSEREELAKEKEEAEREKRTRRNREKKVKRKAREKAKKSAESEAKTAEQDIGAVGNDSST
ncbi:uncharacterized protein BDR25DRAFT_333907 [Lindgomyces ingoldianus]|uniref:Uncharacterized protein n=1 Tax=Lindgomyces ingoldianus TaxID=673940 RepID=A0ACB6QW49_9PLEO|nr:uncharacterized protein BDR25DRAFT_333907 [Lindgomyces ingoldianus]KAF2471243.1 hypothetical protein BDR25DRAFT_333907 [Lindgomyces ingoldianus]